MGRDWMDALGRERSAAATEPRGSAKPSFLAWGTALLFLLLAGGGAYVFLQPPGDSKDERYVAVYLTDLPGGLDALFLRLGAVTVGSDDDPLEVVQPEFELSAHRGADQGLLVAQGRVPKDAGGRVILFVSSAHGLSGGQSVPVDVPLGRVTLDEALPSGDYATSAALFDLDLAAGLVAGGNGFVFQPVVQAAYSFGDAHDAAEVDLARDLGRFVRNDAPPQTLDAIPPGFLDRLCASPKGCASKQPSTGTTGGPGVTASPTPTSTTGSTSSSSPTPTGNPNLPPAKPFGPSPNPGNGGLPLAFTLAWQGGEDPEGRPVSYQVELNGVVYPACAVMQGRICSLSGLQQATTYRWRVLVRDGQGGSTWSDAWDFRTTIPPDAPGQASPASGATEQNLSVTLRFDAADPDAGQTLQYRIYFKEGSAPSASDARCEWRTAKYCVVVDLEGETTYYWQVEVRDGYVSTFGPVWTFMTKESAPNQIPPACPPYCVT